MNDYQSRFLAKAVELYDARRTMGLSEPRSLYSTAAGLADALTVTREKARTLLEGALKTRSETPTTEILSC